MTSRPFRFVLALACLAPAAVRAQTPAPATNAPAAAQPASHPNYSGTWDLDVAASDFGPAPAPSKMSLKVDQSGDKLTNTASVSSAMGDQTMTSHITVGGAASTDTVNAGGQTMWQTTTAHWDGPALVTDTKVQRPGMDMIPVVNRWTLSPDGKTLTVDRQITTPMGELKQHLVFVKKS